MSYISNRKAKKVMNRGRRLHREAQKAFEQKVSRRRNHRTSKTSLLILEVMNIEELRYIDQFMLDCAY